MFYLKLPLISNLRVRFHLLHHPGGFPRDSSGYGAEGEGEDAKGEQTHQDAHHPCGYAKGLIGQPQRREEFIVVSYSFNAWMYCQSLR